MIQSQKIQSGLTIYDYSNILLGGFDNLATLLVQNPQFGSVNVDLSGFVTKEITWDDSFYQSQAVQIELTPPQAASTIKSIRGLTGQNIYDLNLMCYSGLDNLVKFLVDNEINSINDQDVSMKVFNFDTSSNNDFSLNTVINKKKYVFASIFIEGEVITPNEKEFMDGVLFDFQDGSQYDYQR